VGSIGVVGHLVNVHKRLQSWNIEALTFRSGKDKAPLSRLSEVTEAGISAVQNDVDNLQRTFKRHVVESRPILRDVIDHIATGETWLGHDALHQGLVDRVITSDEYISERLLDGATVLKLSRRVASKYPFLPSSPVSAVQASSSPLSSLFPKLQKLLDQSSALLGRFLGDCDSLHAGYMSVKCAGHELTCG
jgi:ClpP class serine protease